MRHDAFMIKKIIFLVCLFPTSSFALKIAVTEASCPFGKAQQILREYCHEISFEKYPGGSYYCRVRLEDDCKKDRTASSCALFAELKKLEDSFLPESKGLITKKEKKEYRRVFDYPNREIARYQRKNKRPPLPEGITPMDPNFMYPIKVKFGSPDLEKISEDKWLAEGNSSESIKQKKILFKELKELNTELNKEKVSLFCTQDSDCQVQHVGQWGCGGPASSFIYSTYEGGLKFMPKVLRMSFLDREIQSGLRGWFSTCAIEGILEKPKCSFYQCSIGGPSM